MQEMFHILLKKYTGNEFSDLLARENLSLEELEKEYIKRILTRTDWNVNKTCEVLKVSKATIYRKIEQYGLNQVK